MKKFALVLLVLLPLLWASFASPQTVFAATIVVNSSADNITADGQCTLREAIQNANDNADTFTDCVETGGYGADVITFDGSVTSITLTSSISITPAGGPDSLLIDGGGTVTLSGGNTTHLFVLNSSDSDLTLDNITIQNGNNNSGGAILATGSGNNLSIQNSRFINNNATFNGGAILSNGSLTIFNSVFQNNDAGDNGGAIYYSSNDGALTITTSLFNQNTAGANDSTDGSGGAIYHDGNTLGLSTITGSLFTANAVTEADDNDGGGAIYHNDGVLVITANAFSGNTVNGDFGRGGAIYATSTTTAPSQYDYLGNLIDIGGLVVIGSNFGEFLGITVPPITILGTDVSSFLGTPNTVTSTNANSGGGAIYNAGFMSIFGSSFVGNTSSQHGGAIFNDASITDNSLFGDDAIIVNSTFADNVASSNGGAIYHNRTDDLLELYNLTIANNTAASGGGIFNAGDGDNIGVSNFDDVRVSNLLLANNTGGNCAGGSLSDNTTSGNHVAFGSGCLIDDLNSDPITPIAADPVLASPQLIFSLPSLLTIAMPLGNGSSASGTGDNAICTSFPVLTLDQQGIPDTRPDGAPVCDIGAYESDQVPPAEINVRDGADTTDITDGDGSPDTGDGTDFGTTPVGAPAVRNFIIQNEGGADLTLGVISVPIGFSVTTAPSGTVIGGGQTTLGVTCQSTTAGTYSGEISIPNNDSTENPYNFAVTCSVEGPEIRVTGTAGNDVFDGTLTTSLVNGTEMGPTTQGSPYIQSFIIQNDGDLNLNVTSIAFAGPGTGFTLSTSPLPATIVPGPAGIFLTVTCTAASAGIFTETITIDNTDFDENPYTFAIRCEVTPSGTPQIAVTGLGNPVDDGGGNSPAIANGTDPGAVAVGSVAELTFTITNPGTVDLEISAINVSGSGFTLVPASITLPTTIGAGMSETFEVACDTSAPASHIGGVNITNDSPAPTDSYTFNLSCLVTLADVRVSKTENTDPVNAGSPIIYTVIIENLPPSTVDALGVVLTEVLPANFTATAITPSQGTCPPTPLTVTFDCTIGTIGAGNTVTVSITGSYDPSAPASTTTNEAYVNYTGFTTGSSGTDADGDDERAIETTDVTINADVSVDKTVNNPTPVEGATIVYTIEVENLGPSTATSVSLIDSLPNGVTYVSHTGAGCAFTAPTLTCSVGTMLPGATYTATITATVDTGAGGLSQPISNTANITASSTDNNGSNNSNDADINVGGLDLAITKTVDNPTPLTGGTIVYSVTVENLSVANATNIEITDLLPAGVVYMSDDSASVLDSLSNPTAYNSGTGVWTIGQLNGGASLTLQITATVTAASGTITNTATLTAVDQTDNNNANDSDDADINVSVATPEINVTGDGTDITDGSNAPNVGDFTQFVTTAPSPASSSRTFVVQNTGTGPLTINSVSTDLPAVFTITTDPTGIIPAGGSADLVIECQSTTPFTYTAIVTIENSDVAPEDEYTFGIACTVATAGVPEINVTGNGDTISSGDTTPDFNDFTNFGGTSVGIPFERLFIIENTGLADLTIGTINVPSGFTVSTIPTATVTSGNSTTLGITCDATTQNTFAGPVSIANNDSTGSENPYTFNITCNVVAAGSPADLSLAKNVSDLTPQFGDVITYTLTITNSGPGSTTGVQVVDILPTSTTFFDIVSVSQGTAILGVDNFTNTNTGLPAIVWDVGTMTDPQTETLVYRVTVNPTLGTTTNYAQVTASSAPEQPGESTPNNGTYLFPAEDDEVAVSFLFDPPFGSKAFEYDGVSVVTWTIIWVNPSTQPIPVQMNDPLLGGTTIVPGSLVCTPFGTSVQTNCTHDTGTNTVIFEGTIAPNPGATVADTLTASNRLVITYSVVVPDGVTSVANTATLTDLDSDVTSTVTETFTRTVTPPTTPPTTGGGTPPLTREEIDAKVTALPATGETPWWSDLLRIGLLMGVAGIGAGAVWMTRRRRVHG